MLAGAICPLTPLESALREAGGGSGFAESFIEHYLLPLIYPGEVQGPMGRGLQVALGVALLLFNAGVYAAALAALSTPPEAARRRGMIWLRLRHAAGATQPSPPRKRRQPILPCRRYSMSAFCTCILLWFRHAPVALDFAGAKSACTGIECT